MVNGLVNDRTQNTPALYPPPSSMSHSYPVSELGIEQLVRALAQVLNPDSTLKMSVHIQFYVIALIQLTAQKFT